MTDEMTEKEEAGFYQRLIGNCRIALIIIIAMMALMIIGLALDMASAPAIATLHALLIVGIAGIAANETTLRLRNRR